MPARILGSGQMKGGSGVRRGSAVSMVVSSLSATRRGRMTEGAVHFLGPVVPPIALPIPHCLAQGFSCSGILHTMPQQYGRAFVPHQGQIIAYKSHIWD